jgi:hypothetical protein
MERKGGERGRGGEAVTDEFSYVQPAKTFICERLYTIHNTAFATPSLAAEGYCFGPGDGKRGARVLGSQNAPRLSLSHIVNDKHPPNGSVFLPAKGHRVLWEGRKLRA